MGFGEFLDQWLADQRWSQGRLAHEAGISQGLVSKWVHPDPLRRSVPSPRNLQKLAPVLGSDYQDLMRICGYLPGEPRAEVDARRQAVRDQLDRWLAAVGPHYEEYFWRHLKLQGDSTVDLIQRIESAVSAGDEASVNTAVSSRRQRGRKPREGGNGPLTPPQRATRMRLDALREEANQPLAA